MIFLGLETSCDETAVAILRCSPRPIGRQIPARQGLEYAVRENTRCIASLDPSLNGGMDLGTNTADCTTATDAFGKRKRADKPCSDPTEHNQVDVWPTDQTVSSSPWAPDIGGQGLWHPESVSVLSHCLFSQDHTATGGVVPQVAAREHLRILPDLLGQALKQAGIKPADLDGIGVTAGPGLVAGLLVGVLAAKGLACAVQKPLWPIHHLQAHGLMVRMDSDVPFPFLLMLLSGGHCLMARVDGVSCYQVLGQSLDDAAGECLDKVARAMGGPYPGGPWIEQYARQGDPYGVALPVPLSGAQAREVSPFAFSFSGLKTACLQWIQSNQPLTQTARADLCASLQRVVGQTLADRLQRGLAQTGLKRCVISGGVAANAMLRSVLEETCARQGATCLAPRPSDCTDNGIMIAWATFEHWRAGLAPALDFRVRPVWPLGDLSGTL